CLAHATAAARTALGPDKVDSDCRAITASEDYAAYARQVPACFAFLGAGDIAEGGTAPLHSRGFDFNDAVLGAGIDFYTALRSEEHTSELQSRFDLVCRLLLEKR